MHSVCFEHRSLGESLDLIRKDRKLFPTSLYYSLYGPREIIMDRPLAKPCGDDLAPAPTIVSVAESVRP